METHNRQSRNGKKWYEKCCNKKIEIISGFGYIPIVNEEENRTLLSSLIGVKMGSGNKASSYHWFKNRLADGAGVIVPRSMIDIFAKAANREWDLRQNSGNISGKNIIRHKCFEDGLPEVSEKRVIDLKEEFVEYALFFENLKDTIQRSPVEENNLSDALEKAGFSSPRDEIINLLNIGVLKQYQRRLSDPVRYHFPDIYLWGLGLQRFGRK